MPEIKKIVLTGGPCAGKTTALVRVIEYFNSRGFKVFTVPEVPTLYSLGGWNYLTPNRRLYYEGERAILETQLALEDHFQRMAEVCTKPVLIVCDRGTMDISAYMKPEEWEDITAQAGTSSNHLRERYDAVLHLVSAADGAEQYYTTATNSTRYEKADEEGLRLARELDKKVIKAWTGHPHLRVINNHDDFDCKMNRVIMEISNVLALPQPIVEERKYIVELTGELASKPRWIPVTERLPEEHVFVLIRQDDDRMMVAERVDGDWWYRYFAYDVDRWDEDEQGTITHWMQLPQPPKEE